jgi:pilus assembly protein CpaF
MRSDRVVGEVRGAEAFELSRAVNAGCGFLCTIHANNAAEALHALVNAR